MSAAYDFETHAWTGQCPHGDECSGCDSRGYCTIMEPERYAEECGPPSPTERVVSAAWALLEKFNPNVPWPQEALELQHALVAFKAAGGLSG